MLVALSGRLTGPFDGGVALTAAVGVPFGFGRGAAGFGFSLSFALVGRRKKHARPARKKKKQCPSGGRLRFGQRRRSAASGARCLYWLGRAFGGGSFLLRFGGCSARFRWVAFLLAWSPAPRGGVSFGFVVARSGRASCRRPPPLPFATQAVS